MRASQDLVIPVSFAGAGLLSAWYGPGGWIGLFWGTCAVFAAFTLGGFYEERRK